MFGLFFGSLWDNLNVFDCVAERGCRVINYCFPAHWPTVDPLFSFTRTLGQPEAEDGPG